MYLRPVCRTSKHDLEVLSPGLFCQQLKCLLIPNVSTWKAILHENSNILRII